MSARKFDRYQLHPTRVPDGTRGAGYIPSPRIVSAVNAALWCGQPLLVTGEAGVGKTQLAESVAWQLGLPEILVFPVRSDSVGRDAVYHFDHLHRMYDALRPGATLPDTSAYVRPRALRTAFEAARAGQQRVLLIDEVDKAPRDFPNDLLYLLSDWTYSIDETGETVSIRELPIDQRPLVIFTSNEENPLPEPFLRRCVYLRVDFPDPARLLAIVRARTGGAAAPPNAGPALTGEAGIAALDQEIRPDDPADALRVHVVQAFLRLRGDPKEWRKAPTTAEVLGWLDVLQGRGVAAAEVARLARALVGARAPLPAATRDLLQALDPFVLVKTRDDHDRLGLAR